MDYVHAFPQAPVEKEIYIKIPAEIQITEGRNEDYVLKMHRNIYGQKQAGRVWNKYFHDILANKLSFQQPDIDECIYYRGELIYLLYTDDSILASRSKDVIDKAINDMKEAGLKITIEGDLQDFLGVHIAKQEGGKVTMTQPQLSKSIIKDLNFKVNTKPKAISAASSKILLRHQNSEAFAGSFNYRSVIGKLNYI